jgi:hypothetical protein
MIYNEIFIDLPEFETEQDQPYLSIKGNNESECWITNTNVHENKNGRECIICQVIES